MGNAATKAKGGPPPPPANALAPESFQFTASVSSTSLSSQPDEEEESDSEQQPQSPVRTPSPSTTILEEDDSGNDHGDHEDDEEDETDFGLGICSMPSETMTCIPSVLTYYRKENPLVLTSRQPRQDSVSKEEEEGAITKSSRRRRRRLSWPPKASSLNFFSKYSTASSSTSSLVSLLSTTMMDNTSNTNNDSNTVPPKKYTQEELDMIDGHLPTEESDLTSKCREYCIVTTAALPWMTGTAVNPLLRAAHLSQYQRQTFTCQETTVTLVIPWLESAHDRELLYGSEWVDKTQDDQEAYIRDWLATKANLPQEASTSSGGIRILFYPARYHASLSSIFAMGDLCEALTSQLPHLPANAVLILEEPEHMHYYRAQRWREHFCHVVGVIHTNYKAYASSAMWAGSFITGPLIERISSWLVRAYCDQVIKLSPVLQSFGCPEKEIVCNVHGIRYDFIQEGARRARELQQQQQAQDDNNDTPTTKASSAAEKQDKIYFLGKLLWAKGLDKLLELEALYWTMTGNYFPIDIIGSGPEQEEIEQAFLSERRKLLGGSQSFCSSTALDEMATNAVSISAEANTPTTSTGGGTSTPTSSSSTSSYAMSGKRSGLATTYYSTFVRPRPPVPARFLGRQDHAQMTDDYKIFVNPSITEVLCTCTAEATAMGKFVIIPDHPSNTFFHQFPNCLLYKTKEEFVEFLQYAMAHDPEPLSDDLIHVLTWEAATERFMEASAISRRDAKWRDRVGKTKSDEKIAKMHYDLGKGAKGDVLRKVLGGGPVAHQFQYDCRVLQAQLTTGTSSSSSSSSSSDESDDNESDNNSVDHQDVAKDEEVPVGQESIAASRIAV